MLMLMMITAHVSTLMCPRHPTSNQTFCRSEPVGGVQLSRRTEAHLSFLELLERKICFASARKDLNSCGFVAPRSPAAPQELPSVETLSAEMESLKRHLSQIDSPTVLCHNDLLTKNIIYNHGEGEEEPTERPTQTAHELFCR